MSSDKDAYAIQVEPIVLGTGVVTGASGQPHQIAMWITAGATYLIGGASLTAGGSFGVFGFLSTNPIFPLENFRGPVNLVNLGNTHTVNILRKFTSGYGSTLPGN